MLIEKYMLKYIDYVIQNVPLYPVLSLFPYFSLPGVLCDSTDLIWRKGPHLRR
jgi:hypothetical protein